MVGAGYVGLVTAVCLADSDIEVRLLDVDEERLEMLRQGHTPIHEPLLDELLVSVLRRGTLVLCSDVAEAMRGVQIAMLAVGTPPLAAQRSHAPARRVP